MYVCLFHRHAKAQHFLSNTVSDTNSPPSLSPHCSSVRLRNRDAYTDILKCLNMYSQEIISRQELMYLVNDIIGKYPDLMVRH